MRRTAVAFLILVIFVSCSTLKTETNDNYFVSKMGSDGDYIFTTKENLLDSDKFYISRISGCYNPETSFVYGVIETDLSKFAFNFGMMFSKSTESVRTANFKSWFDVENNMYYYCPISGIILFASDSIEDVYNRAFGDYEAFIEDDLTFKLLNADYGFYVKKPTSVPEIGLNISQYNVDRFESVCATLHGEILNVDFKMSAKDFADSFFKVIKASVITYTIQNGDKPDLNELRNNITIDDKDVILRNIKFSNEQQSDLLNSIIYSSIKEK